MRMSMIFAIALGLTAPAAAVDCVELVEQYQAKRVETPTAQLRNVFPGWKGAKSLPLIPKDDPAFDNTELLCDENRQVVKLRYAWSWTEEEVDEGELATTVASMLELSEGFAPNSLAMLEAFGRTSESHAIESENLPGPYQVSVQVSVFESGGGVVTLVIEPD